MKNTIRLFMLSAILSCAAGANAQAMFTVNLPMDLKDIPANFTMIRASCTLKGTNPITGKAESIVTGDYTGHAITVPLVAGKLQTTVPIVFDKKLIPVPYDKDPNKVTGADCRFALVDPTQSGGGFTPGSAGLAANKPGTPLVTSATVKF